MARPITERIAALKAKLERLEAKVGVVKLKLRKLLNKEALEAGKVPERV